MVGKELLTNSRTLLRSLLRYQKKEHYLHNISPELKPKHYDGVQKKGNVKEVAPGKSIGDDRYRNVDGKLPPCEYLEADLGYRGGNRGIERMVYSKSDDRIYL